MICYYPGDPRSTVRHVDRRAIAVAATVVVSGMSLMPTSAAPALPVGCTGAHASIHQAGKGTATAEPVLACATSTGYATAESHLNVFPDGTVVMTPAVLPSGLGGTGEGPDDPNGPPQSNASPGALTMTRDDGAHWSLVKPSGTTWNPTDHGDYIDPVTGRLFFEDYGPIPLYPAFGADQEGPAHINVSPDQGKTWTHTVLGDVQLPENPQFTSAPPPVGGDKPVGYPRVTYFCANNSIGFTSPLIAQRNCYRSLDGTHFSPRSVILRSSVPVHPECNGQGENLSAMDGHYPQPAPDGSLYLMVSCGPLTFLARSTDEALTFVTLKRGEGPRTIPLPAASIPDFNSSALQVLSDGTLAVTDIEGGRLRLRVSKDVGKSWSPAVDVTAPGIARAATWTVTSRGSALALAYLGQKNGTESWAAYVSVVRHPQSLLTRGGTTVVSGKVRDVVLYGSNQLGPAVQGAGTIGGPLGTHVPFPPPFDDQTFGNDFLGVALGPDGTAWGSFTLDCGPTPESPGCTANGGQTRGLVGRLVTVSAAAVRRPSAVPPAKSGGGLAATGLPAGAVGLGLVVLVLAGMLRRGCRAGRRSSA